MEIRLTKERTNRSTPCVVSVFPLARNTHPVPCVLLDLVLAAEHAPSERLSSYDRHVLLSRRARLNEVCKQITRAHTKTAAWPRHSSSTVGVVLHQLERSWRKLLALQLSVMDGGPNVFF